MKTPGRRAPTEKWHPACNRISTSMIYIHTFIDRFIAKAYFCKVFPIFQCILNLIEKMWVLCMALEFELQLNQIKTKK